MSAEPASRRAATVHNWFFRSRAAAKPSVRSEISGCDERPRGAAGRQRPSEISGRHEREGAKAETLVGSKQSKSDSVAQRAKRKQLWRAQRDQFAVSQGRSTRAERASSRNLIVSAPRAKAKHVYAAKTKSYKNAGKVNGSAIHPTEDTVRRRFAAAGTCSRLVGWTQTTARVPDTPVTSFSLHLQGASKGLILNSANTCIGRAPAAVKISDQGKTLNQSVSLHPSCGGKGRHKRHRRHLQRAKEAR